MVKLCYFAWVRERIGKAEETVELPAELVTIADVIAHLRGLGPEYEAAFAKPEVVRAAIDRSHVKQSAAISGAKEIAFFPPVTGG